MRQNISHRSVNLAASARTILLRSMSGCGNASTQQSECSDTRGLIMSIRKRNWTTDRGIEKEAWVVDYVDQLGKRRLKTFATKKEADAWAVAARHEVSQGIHIPASTSITVTEAFDRWIANCEAENLEFGTIRQRRQHLRLHIIPFIGSEKLSALTMPRVVRFA